MGPTDDSGKKWACGQGLLPYQPLQKKNYENSNVLPWKNIILKKSSKKKKKKPKSFKILYNSITNLKFQHKPKYHISKILI
jgi:hypothetical protein